MIRLMISLSITIRSFISFRRDFFKLFSRIDILFSAARFHLKQPTEVHLAVNFQRMQNSALNKIVKRYPL